MEIPKLRVLVVEDDDADAQKINQLLNSLKNPILHLRRAKTLEEAMGCLDQGEFHAILVDLSLPGCEGMDAVLGLQAGAPATPILTLAREQGLETIRLSAEAGAQDCLPKYQLSAAQVANCVFNAIQRQRMKLAWSARADRLRRRNSRLFRLSHVDPLTKVTNRRGFQRLLSAETRRSRKDGAPLVAMLADMDGFKEINDIYSHAAGDLALQAVGSCLKQAVGALGHLGRVGGDEFMVLFKKSGLDEAWAAAQRFNQALESKKLALGGLPLPALSASVGIVAVPKGELRLTEIMRLCHGPLKHDKKKLALS